jgi:hypothetical protein
MPLYYLHIRNGTKLELDPDGIELPDMNAAVLDALRVARELLGEVSDLGRETVIEIAEETGLASRTIPFSDVIQASH